MNMKPETLKGFITAAQDLGRTDIDPDHETFLKAEQQRVFQFALEHRNL